MTTTSALWITAFAEQLGVEAPSAAEIDEILALAGAAAHASERTSAPVACWLSARAGLSAVDAREIALKVVAPESEPD